jgi:hypothetical protein
VLVLPVVAFNAPSGQQHNSKTSSNSTLSTIDLANDQWTMNHVTNGNFENWNNAHDPAEISSSRSTERYTWYASSPWPVNESSHSLGIQVRAVDTDHPSTNRVSPGTQISWNDPSNLTVSFDYWIDENANPSTDNYFYLEINLKANFQTCTLRYFLSGTTVNMNSTYYGYYMLDGIQKQWNRFDRNITQDCIDACGSATPTQFNTFYFTIATQESTYTRVFLDDFYLVNNTIRIGGSTGNGNFEGLGFWYWYANADPGDISQSSDSLSGDWSLNATTTSLGNRSRVSFDEDASIRATSINPDRFQFYWEIDSWEMPDAHSFAYLDVEMSNGTEDLHIYYWLCYIGSSPPYDYPGYYNILVNGFNTTGSWNLFNRSIWEDISTRTSTREAYIQSISFEMECNDHGSKLTVLYDNMSLTAAALNDMSYEDQGDVGSYVRAWGEGYADEIDEFRVTDFAYTGQKAANLTAVDGDSIYLAQSLHDRPVTNTTELFLDFNWYLDDYTALENDYITFYLYFGDGRETCYYLATGSSNHDTNTSFDSYIMLQNANQTGQWFNTKRDIVGDYEAAYGSTPSTTLTDIYFVASTDTGGRIELILDDLYIYQGPAPLISGIQRTPLVPQAGQSVSISATIIEDNLDTAFVRYRLDGGAWQQVIMTEGSASHFSASITGQPWNTEVEYYVFANDTFAQETTALNSGDYFSYSVVDTLAPTIQVLPLTNGSTVSGIVNISAQVDGTGSPVQRVEFYVNGSLVATRTAAPYGYSWDTTAETDGAHVVVVKAYDQAGNSAELRYFVTTANVPPGIDPLVFIGAIAGVAIVVVVLLYIVVVRPKRES